jgi:uncharacterized protein (DUF433 family)
MMSRIYIRSMTESQLIGNLKRLRIKTEPIVNLLKRITHSPDICHGKPCIRGLRYPVEMILELLSAGMAPEEILADYEDLEAEDISAVLSFATRLNPVQSIT